jgi:hypothetical protein
VANHTVDPALRHKCPKRPKRGYWIRFHWSECVLCGKSRNWREWVADEPKPRNESKRHIWDGDWACEHHF